MRRLDSAAAAKRRPLLLRIALTTAAGVTPRRCPSARFFGSVSRPGNHGLTAADSQPTG